ncbi:MAG TPA: hypothetical protein VGL19_12270 [Polyangiaceae bacterium]
MPALVAAHRALLRATPVAFVAFVAFVFCGACGSSEATPLGSPSYLPPDPGGAAGTTAAGNGAAGVAGANGGFGGLR